MSLSEDVLEGSVTDICRCKEVSGLWLQRSRVRHESKKKQQNQVRTKRQQLAEVLERHTKHALLSNAAAAPKTVTAAKSKRGKPIEEEHYSNSSDEDSLIQRSELKNSEKEAKFWRIRFASEYQNSTFLKRHVEFLEKNMQQQLTASDQPTEQKAEFSPCDGGLFHLSNNIYITEEQAAKLFKNKKPTILVRDAAQVVWGCDTLAQRSVSGRLCPTKTNSGQEPSKQLTPEKVDVVYGCLAHWGQVNKTDTTLARSNVMRTLCEKIQDCKKKLRMK
ncbi:hypothetical protein MTO96_050727 [Rhipicephalus appendiculatus]